MGCGSRGQDFRSEKNGIAAGVVAHKTRTLITRARSLFGLLPVPIVLLAATLAAAGGGKDKLSYGEGLIVNIPLPESEVAQVVEDIAQNGVIRGTKEYNKDEFVGGAKAATSSKVFPAWNEGGKVFYKVREEALDPRNFKDSSDVGTLVVRYVVQPQGEKNTVLRIDALFAEDFRKVVHQSNGSVEGAEYKDIQEHLEAIEVMKKQTEEAKQERKEHLARKQNATTQGEWPPSASQSSSTADAAVADSQSRESAANSASHPDTTQSSVATPPEETPSAQNLSSQSLSGQSLEEHVKDLRKQVERLVKPPGAPLKSAPFHTASTLETLTTGTEVLILIYTPYWYGVETHEGQHGWIPRDELEQR